MAGSPWWLGEGPVTEPVPLFLLLAIHSTTSMTIAADMGRHQCLQTSVSALLIVHRRKSAIARAGNPAVYYADSGVPVSGIHVPVSHGENCAS